MPLNSKGCIKITEFFCIGINNRASGELGFYFLIICPADRGDQNSFIINY